MVDSAARRLPSGGRRFIPPGDGVYKSTDGGETSSNVGLRETRHIARLPIHPNNPDIVYVAAMGDMFGPNPDRGIYRTTDRGEGPRMQMPLGPNAAAWSPSRRRSITTAKAACGSRPTVPSWTPGTSEGPGLPAQEGAGSSFPAARSFSS